MPKRIRITHETQYLYNQPVKFGPHRAMMRPREGHDLQIVGARVEVEPKAVVRWLRDIESNSVAVLAFDAPADKLRVFAEVDVDLSHDDPIEWLIDPGAASYPFQYAPEEQVELVPYRLPSYSFSGPALRDWLNNLYKPGQVIDTSVLLSNLNAYIHDTLQYRERYDPGVQLPHETLRLGGGTCRDYAVLMMEAARFWGFGARFVTGYVQMADGQHGSTHAWTEIFLPGAGWRGYDPTNNKMAGAEHISVAVARAQENAAPLSGFWEGPPGAFQSMNATVQVVAL